MTRRTELEVQLGAHLGDGATLRTHLERAREGTGRADPRLIESAVSLPASVAPLWAVFKALASGRNADAGIACTEIEAWQRLHGVALTPWEAETLLAMDRTALAAMADSRTNAPREVN